ncbi:MAG: universal stress protein [Actinobacteria bacterium]|nr:MAG: universal stress protein [Actinomycetota bacterium]
MFQRILVGTDGSGTAGAAVAHAAELAKIGGSELIVVSAYKQPDDVPPPFGMPEGQHTAEIGKAILQDVEKRYGGDAKLRTVLREGNPVDAIIDVADEENADVIVVGNRGMGGAKRFVLGSVPNAVSHHAPCHVLIVHTTDK